MKKPPLLSIQDWHVTVAGSHVVDGVNLDLYAGTLHAIMGPNGSGKSSLALSLFRHPDYVVTQGQIMMNGKNITHTTTEERAKLGMFLGFQYPPAIPGVSVGSFLREATGALGLETKDFRPRLYEALSKTALTREFAARFINDGFSGGEKKRLELVQMQVLEPSVVILDEIDSGLDIDGLNKVAEAIRSYQSQNRSVVVITHYPRILDLINPNVVHVMVKGKIISSGSMTIAHDLEKYGYARYMEPAL